jgi:hypothetical protein
VPSCRSTEAAQRPDATPKKGETRTHTSSASTQWHRRAVMILRIRRRSVSPPRADSSTRLVSYAATRPAPSGSAPRPTPDPPTGGSPHPSMHCAWPGRPRRHSSVAHSGLSFRLGVTPLYLQSPKRIRSETEHRARSDAMKERASAPLGSRVVKTQGFSRLHPRVGLSPGGSGQGVSAKFRECLTAAAADHVGVAAIEPVSRSASTVRVRRLRGVARARWRVRQGGGGGRCSRGG